MKMNLREIVQRLNHLPFDNDEMIFVVESYIKEKTGRNVDINLTKDLSGVPKLMFAMLYTQECTKLMSAFCVAQNYYLS